VNYGGLVFGLSAALAIVGALFAVGLRNIFHNILGFALAVVGVAGLFLSLGSDFLAAALILVYVGALAIAMVYAVMLSQPLDLAPQPRRAPKVVAAAGLALLVGAALWLVVGRAEFPPADGILEASAQWAGWRLLSDYVLAFELISVLLVVAMIGAVMVARRARPQPRQDATGGAA
jgi:NADH-quinone oxidoreductase subunit J